jgi:hypothetical protein
MLVQAQAAEAQAARGFWVGPRTKKVENCWCQLEGSSTGSKWASRRALEAENMVRNAGEGCGRSSWLRIK